VGRERSRLDEIIGKSEAMQGVYDRILKAASTDASVVLLGETGTGKDLAATAIHRLSGRSRGPFVPVNCAAIPETLVESEFFGHRKGAFTGAQFDKQGLLAVADGGTLFLDEVAELGPSMQAKLLRALDSGEYAPLGGNGTRSSDVRIIAATNRTLAEALESGRLREDFYYRLNVIQIRLPPLRDRKEDIPLLAAHFIDVFGGKEGAGVLPGRIIERLYAHHWPGNVRELKSTIHQYLSFGDFDRDTFGTPGKENRPGDRSDIQPLKAALDDFEKAYIRKALDRHGGSRQKTAETLGIDKKTLYRKMKKAGLS
jgi:transcriptional regulator with PAS, ATPase and Fis domain